MFKKVHENEWLSRNEKWKVTVLIREFEGVLVNEINVFSRVDDLWKGENQNDKLPKYVSNEVQKAKQLIDEMKYKLV